MSRQTNEQIKLRTLNHDIMWCFKAPLHVETGAGKRLVEERKIDIVNGKDGSSIGGTSHGARSPQPPVPQRGSQTVRFWACMGARR